MGLVWWRSIVELGFEFLGYLGRNYIGPAMIYKNFLMYFFGRAAASPSHGLVPSLYVR